MKSIIGVMASLFTALFLSGGSPVAMAEGTKIKIVTSVAPITNIVKNVGGSNVEVTGIVPDGMDSHTFEPAPSDAKLLNQADIIIFNGLGLETSTVKLADKVKKKSTAIVSLGDAAIPRSERVFEFGHINPHAWPNIALAMRYAEGARDALIKLDPARRDSYIANTSAYLEKLRKLDVATFECVKSIPEKNRKLVTYHDSFAYFAPRYGMKIIAAIQPSDFSEPSPREIIRIIEQLKKEKVPAIFGSEDGFTLQDNSDNTKKVVFELSGLTTATTRTITVADANIEIGKLPTIQKFTSGSGTYTTPAGVRYIQVEMVGGGGGGGGSGTAGSPTAGGAGGNTTFGSTIVVANGGGGGGTAASGDGGTGGTSSLSGATGINLSGGMGGQRSATIAATVSSGPLGGSSAFGGAGGSSSSTGAGLAGATNTGGGGGGAYSASGQASSSGGGAGGYAKAIITSPAASYAYAVGAAGAAGAAGTSGFVGGAGGSGLIVVTEYYN